MWRNKTGGQFWQKHCCKSIYSVPNILHICYASVSKLLVKVAFKRNFIFSTSYKSNKIFQLVQNYSFYYLIDLLYYYCFNFEKIIAHFILLYTIVYNTDIYPVLRFKSDESILQESVKFWNQLITQVRL